MELDLATQLSALLSTSFFLYMITKPPTTQEFKIKDLDRRRKFVTYASYRERPTMTRFKSWNLQQ